MSRGGEGFGAQELFYLILLLFVFSCLDRRGLSAFLYAALLSHISGGALHLRMVGI